MNFPKLNNPLILAPMAEVSYLPFRMLCRKYGAAMAYTEQLSSLALTRNSPRTLDLAKTIPQEKPVGIQLFGRNPDILLEAAKNLQKNFDVIDLNFGCPSKKIVQQGYGSALLREKERVFDIVHTLSHNLKKPLTVKMRSGFKKVEAHELVKVIEKAGASALTIHARTREQGYSGKADWNLIKQIKQLVAIPVIGNGDVNSPRAAEQVLKETKCDYVMIGRAAMKNPWIFRQILHYFEKGEVLEQTKNEKLEMFFDYLELSKQYDCLHTKILRNRAQDFTSGISGSKKIREQLNAAKTTEEIAEVLRAFTEV